MTPSVANQKRERVTNKEMEMAWRRLVVRNVLLDRTALQDVVLDVGHDGLVLQAAHVHLHHHLLLLLLAARAGGGTRHRRRRHHWTHRYRAQVALEAGDHRLTVRWLVVLLMAVHVVQMVLVVVSVLSLMVLKVLHVVVLLLLLLQVVRRVI